MSHVHIPPRWSGAEAMSVITFLERVIHAIWRQHGDEMLRLLRPEPDCRPDQHLGLASADGDDIDADIPF